MTDELTVTPTMSAIHRMNMYLYNLRFAVKHLQRVSKKLIRNSEQEREKVKKALKKGDLVEARQHAENAVRQVHLSHSYESLGNRVNAMASRVRSAMETKTLTQSMFGAVRTMDVAMRSKNVEKIAEVVDKFDRQFTEAQQAKAAKNKKENSQGSPGSSILDEVENILKKASADVAAELNLDLPEAAVSNPAGSSVVTNSLIQKLKKMRNE